MEISDDMPSKLSALAGSRFKLTIRSIFIFAAVKKPKEPRPSHCTLGIYPQPIPPKHKGLPHEAALCVLVEAAGLEPASENHQPVVLHV